MQKSSSPMALLLSGWSEIATLISIPVTAFITWLFTRDKQKSDKHKTDAEAGKIQAETRQIDGAMIVRAYERMAELETMAQDREMRITVLNIQKEELRNRLRDAERRNAADHAELKLLQQQMDKVTSRGYLVDEPITPELKLIGGEK